MTLESTQSTMMGKEYGLNGWMTEANIQISSHGVLLQIQSEIWRRKADILMVCFLTHTDSSLFLTCLKSKN